METQPRRETLSQPAEEPVYRRILLKLSGEALMGAQPSGIASNILQDIARELREVQEVGTQVGVVIGGGNLFRGVAEAAKGIDRVTALKMATTWASEYLLAE
ncbi:MAG: hypothetical protein ACE5IM_12335, partial [Nitrospinota bacterium]